MTDQNLRNEPRSLFDTAIMVRAALDSMRKLDPRHQVRNPVMFVVEIGAVITTGRLADPGLRRPARSAAATSPPGSRSRSASGSG